MTALFAVATTVGLAGLVGWALARGMSQPSGAGRFDPEVRFGAPGRLVVSGILGFGLAGMSATFAGWASGLALVAAVGGAVALTVLSSQLGPVASDTE